jgi:DNA-binding beta-propeller fold protein YncE
VKKELERIEIPDEHDAHERSWAVVSAAFAEREPQPRRRSWKPAAVVALAVVVVAGLLSPPGRAVLDEIRTVVGVEGGAPALFALPAPGRLLVTADSGVWVVDEDGSKRLVGDYREASWSPFGRYVVAARSNELVALTPDGTVRWSLARPGVRLPRWGGSRTDTRIAYFSRGQLRVVGGDGKGDRLLDADTAERAPVWLRGDGHRLAYATRDGTVRVVDTDTGAVIDRNAAARLLEPSAATSSPDGRWTVVGWADADQLVFTRLGRPRQIQAVSDVSAQFRSRSFPTIEGWCCAP